MGSFYATCSVTRHTISDGQPMYMQFMLPSKSYSEETSIGEMFKESFLNVVKSKGLDEAIKSFDESTSTWGKGKELSPKGMNVSNDSASQYWTPFGPAIRGHYNDYGNIEPAEDEDSQRRVKILEDLVGLPFSTIMDVAQDDRWFTLGLGKYAESGDWKPEGIHKDMPDWQLHLCQKLSLTYFHASVYDQLVSPDFSSEERDGIMKSKYDKKWKKEYIDGIKKNLKIALEGLNEVKESVETPNYTEVLEKKWKQINAIRDIGPFRLIGHEIRLTYISRISKVGGSIDWFYESLNLMWSLSGMCIPLQRSDYGSQHLNFFGWERIYKALNPDLQKTLEEYGYLSDEEDEEEE